MSRQRVEDLGRLMERLEQIVNHQGFHLWADMNGLEDFEKWFDFSPQVLEENEQLQGRIIEFYGEMENIRDNLVRCLEIAKGQDCLNERDDA